MITIGIRARPDSITFAVYDSGEPRLLNVEVVKIPKALPTPEGLKYLRNSVLDIIGAYRIERAGIRTIEASAKYKDPRRIEIEGVIQESFASSHLQGYYCGQIATIASRIGIDRKSFKPLVDGTEDFDKVENWRDLSKEAREAVLVALGAVHA